MTVSSVMVFNREKGLAAVVTDEQSVLEGQVSNHADKIHHVSSNGTYAVFGGAGQVNILAEGIQRARSRINGNGQVSSAGELGEVISKALADLKSDLIKDAIEQRFRITEEELQEGMKAGKDGEKIPIDEQTLAAYHQELHEGEIGEAAASEEIAALVGLLADDSGVSAHHISLGQRRPQRIERDYLAIGEGAPIANRIMRRLFDTLGREGRKDVDPIEGVATLLRTVDEASRDTQGVGGSPNVMVLSGKKVLHPGVNRCRLAGEIVRVYKERPDLLPDPAFRREAIDRLIFKRRTGDFERVDRKMGRIAGKNRGQLYLFLRDYPLNGATIGPPT